VTNVSHNLGKNFKLIVSSNGLSSNQVTTFSLKNNLMANDEIHLIKIMNIFVSFVSLEKKEENISC